MECAVEEKTQSTKERVFEFMDGRSVMVVMLIATLWALFAMDIYFMLGISIDVDKVTHPVRIDAHVCADESLV